MPKNEISYKIELDAEISGLTSKLAELRKSFGDALTNNPNSKMNSILTEMEKRLDSVKNKINTPAHGKGAFTAIERDLSNIITLMDKFEEERKNMTSKEAKDKISFLPKDESKRLKDILDLMSKAKGLLDSQKSAADKLKIAEQKKASLLKQQNEELKKNKTLHDQLNDAREKQRNVDNIEKEYERQGWDKNKTYKGEDGTEYNLEAAKAVALTADEYKKLNSAVKASDDAINNFGGRIKTQENRMDEAREAQSKYKTELDAIKKAAKDAGISLQHIGTNVTDENVARLTERLMALVEQGLIPYDLMLQQIQDAEINLNASVGAANEALQQQTQTFIAQDTAAGQVNGILNRIKQFTGLTGAALVARRALHNAVETIKELDQQMTEMAVVTDLEVGDYWQQLPEHTERANALGMAIKDVYEAETLYYQQGLKTAQVTKLATSTLKMARIAGLSAEDATNKMTAALRGFNMEISETNADRIADVYSKLAAITASDVNEISTAMTRTASLAHNAGMEFETTAAFLAQIIETTRESAETAGTALKTVIARFQELKKSPDEIGEVDGEVVDANKIETALRSVDVALRDTTGQFRALDQVFLELASKWDSLDTNTQRYIATIAAGSRQQSRFIAMMSDYSRTQELVQAANNAAGASNEQFQKTLDSLESKFAALKNAWDTFTMGLANNEIIKTGISLFTGFLDVLNKVTQGWDTLSGTFLKTGTLVTALIAGDKALTAFRKSFESTGSILKSFGAGMKAPVSSLYNFIKGLTAGHTKLVAYSKNLSTVIAANKDLQASFQSYKWATDQVINASTTLENLQKAGKQNTDEYTIALGNQNAALALQAESSAALGSVLQFNSAQMTTYNSLTALGISTDSAAILTKAGVTTETLKQMAATQKLTMSKAGEILADKLSNASSARQLSFKIALRIQTWAQKRATDADTKSKLANTAAAWAMNASMAPLLILIVAITVAVGLLALAIIGLVRAFQDMEAHTPAGQLKAAQKALKDSEEQAREAKTAYDELINSLDELSDRYSNLDTLVVGTKEWKNALTEVNEEVLDLIDKYPLLTGNANYLKNENGILTITEEGREALKRAESETLNMNYAAVAANQRAVVEKTLMSLTASLSENRLAMWGYNGENGNNQYVIDRATSIEMTDKIAQAIATDGIRTDEVGEYLRKNATDLGLNTDEYGIEAYIQDLEAYGNAGARVLTRYARERQEQLQREEAISQIMINNAISMMDTYEYTTEQINALSNVGITAIDHFYQEVSDQLDKLVEEGHNWQADEQYQEYWKKYYGTQEVQVQRNGSIKIKKDNKWEEVLQDTAAIDQYKGELATQRLKDQLEVWPNLLQQLTTEQKRLIEDQTGGSLLESDLTLDLNTLYDQYAESFKAMYGGRDEFIKEMTKRQFTAQLGYNDVNQRLKSWGLEGALSKDSFAQLEVDAKKGLTRQIEKIMSVSGVDGANAFLDSFNALLSDFSTEDMQKITAQFSALNITNLSDLEHFRSTLQSLGYSLPEDKFNDFLIVTKEVAKSFDKLDLEKMDEVFRSTSNFIKEISSGEAGRIISDELYQSIKDIPALVGQFFRTTSGDWIYKGNSLDTLINSIQTRDVDRNNEQATLINNRLSALDVLADVEEYASLNKHDVKTSSAWTLSDQRQYLEKFILRSRAVEADLTGINEYLSYETDANQISDTILKSIMSSLRNLESKPELIAQLARVNAQSMSYQYQTGNVYNSATIAAAQKAAQGTLTADDLATYMASRWGVQSQAVAAGLSETEIKKMQTAEDKLTRLEQAGEQNTEDYQKAAKVMNNYMKIIADKTGFRQMRQQMAETIERNNELLKSYKETTSEKQKMSLVSDMVSDFDISVTQQNYQELAKLTNEYTQGSEEAFLKLINYAAQAAGVVGHEASQFAGTTKSTIAEWGEEASKFAQDLIDKGYAQWNQADEFVYVLSELKDLTKEIADETTRWVSQYDWLYNANQKNNAELRKRNRLEFEYEAMLESHEDTFESISDNLENQIQSLFRSSINNHNIFNDATEQLTDYVNYLNKQGFVTDFLHVGANGQIQIDKEKLYRSNFNSDQGDWTEEVIGHIEELQDTMSNAEESQRDIYNTLRDIRKTGKEELTSLLDRATEALQASYQKQIDRQSTINDAINEARESLADKLQEKIDDDRKARDEQKELQNIQDKQTRLAYLRASGGNQLDILKLEKEIAEDQEAFQDKMVDNALENMRKTNDKAAEQREQQIAIAQAQYDWWSEHTAAHDAEALVNESLEAVKNGADISNTKLGQLLAEQENVAAQTTIGIKDWDNELKTSANLANLYNEISNPDSELGRIYTAAENQVKNSIDEIGKKFDSLSVGDISASVLWSIARYSHSDSQNLINSWERGKEEIIAAIMGNQPKEENPYANFHNNTLGGNNFLETKSNGEVGITEVGWDYANILLGVDRGNTAINSFNNTQLIKFFNMLDDLLHTSDVEEWDQKRNYLMSLLESRTRYTSGGLADFTGPAWLDGTKSNPEMVLDSVDTANLISLKDILADILRNVNDTGAGGGSNYYDIKIDVDSVDSDYGVDRAAERIKELIEDDARYRNVNAVEKTR